MKRLALTMIGLGACATTTTMPRGLSASEHLSAAVEHDDRAAELAIWPETSMMSPGGYGTRDRPLDPMPWRSWDTVADHERLAAIHRSQAAALEVAYEEACGTKSTEAVSVAPLAHWPTIVYVSRDDDMRCRHAFLMLAGGLADR
jgi:hypothetical protein